MAPYVPLSDDEGESHSDRLARKSREAPFMPIGLAGLTGAVLFGAYKYRNRGSMSTSVYLMQLRVAAQGMVVIALAGGVAFSMFQEYVLPKLIK